jgi:SAM-dependent methyltransferase
MKATSRFRYFTAALALKILSSTGFLRRFYRFLGNHTGERHTAVTRVEIGRGLWLYDRLRELGFSSERKISALELGTGWTHFYAVFLRLFFPMETALFDVQDNRNFFAFRKRCENLLGAFATSPLAGLEKAGEGNAPDRLLKEVIRADDFPSSYRLLDMTYLVDERGRLDGLADNSFDLVFSVDVLEHVERDVFSRSMDWIYRALKPGGISIHQVGLDDHLAHYAPGMPAKNYLRYSTPVWKFWFENRLQYFNRMQAPEILSAFDASGFESLHCATQKDSRTACPKVHAEFRRFDQDALDSVRACLIHRKPAG